MHHGTRLLVLAVVAALAGLGVGRFVTYDGGRSNPPAVAGPSGAEQRVASLKQATIERPTDARAWQSLASNYVSLAVATARPDYFAAARKALDKAAELAPNSLVTLVSQGTFALTLHQFEEALRLGTAAEALDPFNAEAKAVRVDALVELGRYDEAAAVLEQLLNVRPGLAALTRVSYLRQLTGDFDGALAAMRQARTAAGGQASETAVTSALEGEIQLLRGDFESARDAFGASLRQSPGLIAGELGRAKHLDISGDRRGAIRTLEAAVERTGAPGQAVLLGELYESEGRTKSAVKAFAAARQAYRDEIPQGGVVDLELALLDADHGPATDALASARAAYAARPNIYTADAMAWALYRNDRAAEAVVFVEESLRRGTADATLLIHAATVLAAAGDTERAREVVAPAVTRGGYVSPGLRPLARATVAELGFEIPSGWR